MSHEECKLRYRCIMVDSKVCDASKADGCEYFKEKEYEDT